ncbi:Bug family tripartite tricarboxylate transporter substrate binding protein [Lutibaculum baratangense]|uniref:Uncharacterized protein UPF0065 n=1 Tax=Lutibaculum baratangense AMV1 TaxID=631454 RepID=V4RKJ2_9HYPH|nr:tripartite tricarboxylate transporter substrate binding protein [Lutibaculum baratangense]ESR23780.1 Uncharacterized protein UPF0065 [Lutibaculum baratangense AMV1]
MFKRWILSVGAVLAVAVPGAAFAQRDYPSRPIEIIVPFSPGGSTGLTARAVGTALEKHWDNPVRVVNKPGGNTVPAVQEVMQANPDGYTVLADSPASASMLEVVVPTLPFEVLERSFLGMIAQTPMIFVVPSNSPFETLEQAVDALKEDPSSFSWTSLGGAGAQDYTFRQLFKSVGVDVANTRPVASKGGSEAVTMTAGGNVMLGAGSWSAIAPLESAGNLRVLAVAAPERHPGLPDAPTTAESGFPGVEILFWFAISGPAGLPDEVVSEWSEALEAVTQDPELLATLRNIGMVPYFHAAGEMRDMVTSEKAVVEDLWAVK